MVDPANPVDGVLVIYAHSRPGVLAKIANHFYRRALNIRTLTAGTTHTPELSKIVVRVAGRRTELDRVAKALDNLVDVLSVELSDLAAQPAQELCLIRIAAADDGARAAVRAAVTPFHPATIDDGADSVVLEVAAAPAVIDQLIADLAPFPILDVSRTGATSLPAQRAPAMPP